MKSMFPQCIQDLPEVDIKLENSKAFLCDNEKSQVMFMEFESDAEISEHSHAAQYGIVLEGRIEILIDGVKHEYLKGDRYFIPEGIKHSVKIHSGYADITFFNQKDRYLKK